MATYTSTSTHSTTLFNLRSNSVEPRVVRSSNQAGCGKLDGVAMWFVNGLATAFFASLERCSCIRIATEDDGDDVNDDLPLIFNDGNGGSDGFRRRKVKGKKGGATLHGEE